MTTHDATFFEDQERQAERDTVRVFAPPTQKDERDFTLRALVNAVEDLRTVPTFNRVGDVYRALDDYENAVIAAGGFGK